MREAVVGAETDCFIPRENRPTVNEEMTREAWKVAAALERICVAECHDEA